MTDWKIESITEDSPKLHQHSAVVLNEEGDRDSSLMLVYGGEDNHGYWTNSLYTFDLINFQWKRFSWKKPTSASFPPKKDGHTALQYGRDLVIFGGSDNQFLGGGNNTVYALNVDTLEWSVLSLDSSQDENQVPDGKTLHSACLVGDEMYVFGGRSTKTDKSKNYFNDLHTFNLKKRLWHKLEVSGDIPIPRFGHSMVYDGKKHRLLVFGGLTHEGYSNELFSLDLSSLHWERLDTHDDGKPEPRERHSALIFNRDSKMIIYGGWKHGGPSNECYILDLNNMSWIRKPTFEQGHGLRYGHSAVLFNEEEQMLIYGGKDQIWENRGDIISCVIAEKHVPSERKEKTTTALNLESNFGNESNVELSMDDTRVETQLQIQNKKHGSTDHTKEQKESDEFHRVKIENQETVEQSNESELNWEQESVQKEPLKDENLNRNSDDQQITQEGIRQQTMESENTQDSVEAGVKTQEQSQTDHEVIVDKKQEEQETKQELSQNNEQHLQDQYEQSQEEEETDQGEEENEGYKTPDDNENLEEH